MVSIKKSLIACAAALAVSNAAAVKRETQGTAVTSLAELIEQLTGGVVDTNELWKALTEGPEPAKRETQGTAVTSLAELIEQLTGGVVDTNELWKALTEGPEPAKRASVF